MLQKELFGCAAFIDSETTAKYYETKDEWGCECGDCRAFVALAKKRGLPTPLHEILDTLGIAAEKATYVCEIMPKDGGHLYEFSYRIAGEIADESADNSAVFPWGEVRLFHEIYPYGAPDFPKPHFDLEFWLTLKTGE